MTEKRTRPFVEALEIRPEIITNNRLGIDGDIKTPEQFVPVTGHDGDWETCMTMNRTGVIMPTMITGNLPRN